MTSAVPPPILPPQKTRLFSFKNIAFDVALVLVFLAAIFFRVTGLYWGEYTYLHPDERFLIWVGTDITPMVCDNAGIDPNACPEDQLRWMTPGEYFDTTQSMLNPQNRGHGFYVYGTLPMFFTRMVVQWVFDHSGFEEMTKVGRALSSFADTLTVLLVFMIGSRAYDRRVGILAAALMAGAVLHIQQSHFFTMDTFITFFTILAFYFAILVSLDRREWGSMRRFWEHPLFLLSLLFGIALGMAVASKLNAFLMAAMLPMGMLIRLVNFPKEERLNRFIQAAVFLVMAGLVSLLTFRVFQPYAFTGPGFFNFRISPDWWQSIQSLLAQMSPDTDFPPAWQWARRSIFFSGQNLVVWGLGLPLGILAFSGFIWVGWRMLRSIGRNQAWQQHALLWVWTAAYFGYQSLAPNPTMRYQMPVYPTLVIFAAWAVVALWDNGKRYVEGVQNGGKSWLPRNRWKWLSLLIGVVVVAATFGWAYAFTTQYTRTMTRVAGTRWIFNNIPGPVTLPIQLGEDSQVDETIYQGIYNQPLPLPNGFTLRSNDPYTLVFRAKENGRLEEIYFPHIIDPMGSGVHTLEALVSAGPNGQNPLATGSIEGDFSFRTDSPDPRGEGFTILLDQPVDLIKDQNYYLRLNLPVQGTLPSFSTNLSISYATGAASGETNQIILDRITVNPAGSSVEGSPEVLFTAPADGVVKQVELTGIQGIDSASMPELSLTFLPILEEQDFVRSDFIPVTSDEEGKLVFKLETPIPIVNGAMYQLRLSIPRLDNQLAFSGDSVTNEGDWDEAIPVRLDGYDPFGGIYPPNMVLQIFWEDTPEKLEHMVDVLDGSDYIAISSNRRWGTQPRIPERWPMTAVFFRSLLGCPPESDLLWCYRVADPGTFTGELGFDLVKVFQSNPSIGPIRINDQFAEEAFTVYDHPKVLIFAKNEDYTSENTRQILSSANLDNIVRKPPLQYDSNPADLLLPVERFFEQRMGGVWSQLFDTQALINRYQPLTVLVWYLVIFLVGAFAYPLIRTAFPGLNDRGYPLARIAGLLVFSYLVWIAGSFQVNVTPLTITVVFLLFATLGVLLAIRQWGQIKDEWRQRKRYFLLIEGLFLAFFLLDLLIRLGNPDIWHPFRGGERPMDFAYFNAVLKSTSFPPYDPWYAGGYLNYYYYGFVLFGIPVKWLGIVPAVAHNLMLPTIFAMIAMGAFSLAWNLFTGIFQRKAPEKRLQFLSGITGALGMAVLGNLGTVRMIWQGFQRIAAPGGEVEGASVISKLFWGVRGLMMAVTGDNLPFSLGDWYWIPSRTIPAMGDIEPITEFPFFTVLFSDTHAHLYALPLTLLALAFAVSVVLSKARWSSFSSGAAGFLLGALAIGSLRPTNTWDFPTYLALGMVALAYSLMAYFQPSQRLLDTFPWLSHLPRSAQRALVTLLALVVLVGLSLLLFQPYSNWYALGYSEVRLWQGPRSPISSFLVHWGVFLFIIISWMVVLTRDWMAKTPVSALRKIQKNAGLLAILAGLLLMLTLFLAVRVPGVNQTIMKGSPFGNGVVIALITLPLAAWAGVLLLRPVDAANSRDSGNPDNLEYTKGMASADAHKIVLFLVGTGLVLALMVEIIVLVGDIGRMNTVFKFYLQVWTLFSISAAAALGWLVADLPSWVPTWRKAWQAALIVLVCGAALFPIMGGMAKIRDRMDGEQPITLDGMKYMESAVYDWKGPMDLSQDYRAILWLQENVGVVNQEGSPVIVEANLRDLYRWGSRFSIYTGLPSVVGWEWHQQQQRAINPGAWVSNRIAEVDGFYSTVNIETALEFMRKYDVKFIIVGQLERNIYPALGLEKFKKYNGLYWDEVYRDEDTLIYQVPDAVGEVGYEP